MPRVRPGSATSKRLLVYVNQVYPDDYTGQGTFERELIAALGEHIREHDLGLLRVFTVRRPASRQTQAAGVSTVALTLDKNSTRSYLIHQFKLLVSLARELLRYWRDDVTIYARYAPSSIAPVLLSTLLRRRLVVRTGPALQDLAVFQKFPGPCTYLAVRLSFRWNCWKANPLVVVTEQAKRSIAAQYAFVENKTVVIPNGANVDHFPLSRPDRARWRLNPDGMVLGFVGFIYEDQGLDTVIRALARLKQETGSGPQFLVVGDGPCLQPWSALARELGVDDLVIFAGERPYSEIPSAIAACDVMLAPFTRRTFEVTGSSSLKLFEYLACDKPVLAARSIDHQFLADAGVGWLVEPEDVDAWAAAIRDRLREAPHSLAGRGRRLVEEQFSYRRVAERIWSACFDGHSANCTSTPERNPAAHA